MDRIVVVARHSMDTDKACSLIKIHIVKVEKYVVADTLYACSVFGVSIAVDKVAIGTAKPFISFPAWCEKKAAEVNAQIGFIKFKIDILFSGKTA